MSTDHSFWKERRAEADSDSNQVPLLTSLTPYPRPNWLTGETKRLKSSATPPPPAPPPQVLFLMLCGKAGYCRVQPALCGLNETAPAADDLWPGEGVVTKHWTLCQHKALTRGQPYARWRDRSPSYRQAVSTPPPPPHPSCSWCRPFPVQPTCLILFLLGSY